MIDYIKGEIVELTPAEAVIEQGGIGYSVNISLQTYGSLANEKSVKLYVYEAIREDAHLLYGFLTKTDRQLFLLLLSVSGVGANTARVVMSSLTTSELKGVIESEDVKTLKSVKGIGAKTAERIIVELKDKMEKVDAVPSLGASGHAGKMGEEQEEAVEALVMLGFQQTAARKAVQKVSQENPGVAVGQLVKLSLKAL